MNRIFFLFLLFINTAFFAQKNSDTISTNQLEEVKLTTQRYSKSIKNSSQQFQTITKSEIELQNSQTTAEILSNSGKLSVQKSQQGGGSPVIRGLEASRILLLVDGIRMNNLIFRAGHLQNIISIDENFIENIDVLYGPSSTAYGTDALGGAINIQTKKPKLLSENKDKKFSANISTRYSTINQEKKGALDFGFSGTNWATLTAVSYNSFGDLKMGSKKNGQNDFFGSRPFYIKTTNEVDEIVANPNPLIQKFSGYNQFNIMQKVVYETKKNWQHAVNFQYSKTSDIPRYDRLTDLKSNGDLKTVVWNYGPQKRLFSNYKITKNNAIFNSDMSLDFNYQNYEESRISRDFQKTAQTTRLEKVNVYSFDIDLKTKVGRGDLLYGFEALYDDVNSTANKLDIITNESNGTTTRYPNGKNYTYKTEAFASYFSNINKKTNYNLGIRGGYTKLHSDIKDNSFFNFPVTNINQKNFTFSSSAGIVNNSTKNIKVGFNIGSGFRVPNIDDLSKIFDSTEGTLIIPNSNLKPEKTLSGDLNLTYYNKDIFEFENVFFVTRLYDAIVVDAFLYNNSNTINYEGDTRRVLANQNLGSGNIIGYSTNMKAKLFKQFYFTGSFNFTQGRLESIEGEKPLDHIPPFYGKTALNYNSKYVNLDLFMIYNGKKNISEYSTSGEDNQQYAPKNGTAGWQTLNIKSAIKATKNFTVFSGVENIFDIQYRTFASGINAPGKNYYFGAKYTL